MGDNRKSNQIKRVYLDHWKASMMSSGLNWSTRIKINSEANAMVMVL